MPTYPRNLYPQLKKSLGQHFLVDPTVCQRMLAALALDSTDSILEIGPGAGALTHVLEQAPHARLIALEKDPAWAYSLQKNAPATTHCVLQDALTFAYERLPAHWTLVGNLPYNIASPLIWTIAAQTKSPKQVLFMVQKEVGDRLCAQPGCKDYGALSVWVQSFWRPKQLFVIKPQAFQPKPKVDSSVVFFRPLKTSLSPSLYTPVKRLLDLCFQKRRKQLATILRQAQLPDWQRAIASVGLEPTIRPEAISPENFQHLATIYASVLTN